MPTGPFWTTHGVFVSEPESLRVNTLTRNAGVEALDGFGSGDHLVGMKSERINVATMVLDLFFEVVLFDSSEVPGDLRFPIVADLLEEQVCQRPQELLSQLDESLEHRSTHTHTP